MSCNGCEPFELLVGIGDPTTPPDECKNYPFYYDMHGRTWWVWTDNGWQITLSPIRWMSEAHTCQLDEDTFLSINQGGTPGDWDSGDYKVTTLLCVLNWIIVKLDERIINVGQGVGIFDGIDTTNPLQPKIRLRSVHGIEGIEIRLGADTDTVEVRFNPPTMTDQQEVELAQQLAGNVDAMQILAAAMRLGWIGDVEITNPQTNEVLVYDATTDKWKNAGVPAQPLDWHTDVTITSPPTDKDLLSFDAGQNQWVNKQVPLDDLSDVTIGATTDKDLLAFDAGQGQWVNRQVPIDDLANVTINNPVDGEILTYQGGQWVNGTPPTAGASNVVLARCVEAEDTVPPPGLQEGDYWLDATGSPVTLYQRSGGSDVEVTASSGIEVIVCCNRTMVWKLCDGNWQRAQFTTEEIKALVPEEVLVVYPAASEADAVAAGMGAGDHWLNTSQTPPQLMDYDGTTSTPSTSVETDLLASDDGTRMWVRRASTGQFVEVPIQAAPNVPNETQIAICAASQSDAVAAGLQANEYWLDTSTTPPVLKLYDGTNSTAVAASDLPEFVFCMNTGATYAYRGGQYNLLPSNASLQVRTQGIVVAVCAASQSDAVAAGLQPGGYWLDGSVSPKVLYQYDGTSSVQVPASELPAVVFCCNNSCIYALCGNSGYAFFAPSATPCSYGGTLPPGGTWVVWQNSNTSSGNGGTYNGQVMFRWSYPKENIEIGCGASCEINPPNVIHAYRLKLANPTAYGVTAFRVVDMCIGWYDSTDPSQRIVNSSYLLPKPTFNNGQTFPIELQPGDEITSDIMLHQLDYQNADFYGLWFSILLEPASGNTSFTFKPVVSNPNFTTSGLREKTSSLPAICDNDTAFTSSNVGPGVPVLSYFEWYKTDS